MIQSKIVNGSKTIIYVGGGNYMTQAAPTTFHVFLTSKALVKGESIEDWREVTPAEKAQLEQADAQWVRPPQSFIDEWNEACHFWHNNNFEYPVIGQYNENTGFFELNGIKDIHYKEAFQIKRTTQPWSVVPVTSLCQQPNAPIRTNFPICSASAITAYYWFYTNYYIEVVRLFPKDIGYLTFAYIKGALETCPRLRKVIGILDMSRITSSFGLFTKCPEIEDFRVYKLMVSWHGLSASPKVNLESLTYLISNAVNTSAITVTVHADVFAKLTDESNAEWYAVNQAAIAKQISFAAA